MKSWRFARLDGLVLFVLGAIAVIAPLFSSVWGLPIVGLAIFFSGIVELVEAWWSGNTRFHYTSAALSLLAGALVASQSAFVFSGLMVGISVLLAIDGALNITRAFKKPSSPGALKPSAPRFKAWDALNGVANLALAILIWWLRDTIGPLTFGMLVGARMAASGWQTMFAPAPSEADEFARLEDQHPDRALRLEPSPVIGFIHREAIDAAAAREPIDAYWSLIFVVTFFAIHVGRLDAEWTWLGMLSPAVATVGDIVASLVLALVVLAPSEIVWRRLTRPMERIVWHRMLQDTTPASQQKWAERAARWWAEHRLRRSVARDLENNTLPGAVRQTIRAGLPLTAVLIAVNPIWGFSWYFNSENWAAAAWQKIAASRTDPWREAMIDAVMRQNGVTDIADPNLFAVAPAGIGGDRDFAFIVIGDPGEGDPSQHALRDQLLRVAGDESVKFIVVSSDVVYPFGAMKDYEANFYLPLKGIARPVYAIPGNHDWFNALDGFAANLMRPEAARAAILARIDADLRLSSTTPDGIDRLIAEASRLRSLYRLNAGLQQAPFFEIHAEGFSLIAIDTGTLRKIDDAQMRWLRAALDRAGGRFTMAIVGHPFYAGGVYQEESDASFKAVHDLLRARNVRVVMAGDTHDFEYLSRARRRRRDALCEWRWRRLFEHRNRARLAGAAAGDRLRVLSTHGCRDREAGS